MSESVIPRTWTLVCENYIWHSTRANDAVGFEKNAPPIQVIEAGPVADLLELTLADIHGPESYQPGELRDQILALLNLLRPNGGTDGP